jgi:atypical dual specificity phosphatase
LPSEWFSTNNYNNTTDVPTNATATKTIDYLHISIQDYGAHSLEELDYVVNHISQQIDRDCSGGKARTGTILAAYLIKKESSNMTADNAIKRLNKIRGESIQSEDQERIVFYYEKYIKNQRA